MVEILNMLGRYLQDKTGLPFDIQPTLAVREDVHFVLTLEGLDIQVLHTFGDRDNSLDLIGIGLGIELAATGADLVWIERVYTASLKANLLFSEYFNVTIGKEALGFSCALEKQGPGRFAPLREGSYPFAYSEKWNATITLQGGYYGKKTEYTGRTSS